MRVPDIRRGGGGGGGGGGGAGGRRQRRSGEARCETGPRARTHRTVPPLIEVSVQAGCGDSVVRKATTVFHKLQALVYDILPPATALFSYDIGSRKLSANEQFCCCCFLVLKPLS